mgnify:CR=1 FL=1
MTGIIATSRVIWLMLDEAKFIRPSFAFFSCRAQTFRCWQSTIRMFWTRVWYFGLRLSKSWHWRSMICTSGTAAANYLPAVIEAAESNAPLLVFTADRPPEMRDCRSGQTIDQQKLYGGFQFKDVKTYDPGLKYKAVQDGQADAVTNPFHLGERESRRIARIHEPRLGFYLAGLDVHLLESRVIACQI